MKKEREKKGNCFGERKKKDAEVSDNKKVMKWMNKNILTQKKKKQQQKNPKKQKNKETKQKDNNDRWERNQCFYLLIEIKLKPRKREN